MKIKDKKINIEINGEKKSGYVVRLPPTQTPNDFFINAEELRALYELLKSYYEKN